jgi:hypothetical protein
VLLSAGRVARRLMNVALKNVSIRLDGRLVPSAGLLYRLAGTIRYRPGGTSLIIIARLKQRAVSKRRGASEPFRKERIDDVPAVVTNVD